jgi:hypothetical protein
MKKTKILSSEHIPNAGFPPLREEKKTNSNNKYRFITSELSKKSTKFEIDDKDDKINEIKSL